jgi:hypothetical protein
MSTSSRTLLVTFFLLLFVALTPLVFFAAITIPNALDLKEIARRTANEYDRLWQLRMQQTFTFAAFPSIRAFASSTPETRAERASVALNELKALVASDKNVREALIVDANGTVIMSTLDGWGSSLAQRQFVRAALNGHIALSPVARDRAEYSNYYAAPVLNNANEIAGAFVLRVAAQELWDVLPRGENFYAVLSDENGVRLDDTGDPARRMASFGALDAARAAQLVSEQNYGAEMPLLRATNLERAQHLVTQGALDQLDAADFDAGAWAYQRTVSKPWTVLVLAAQTSWLDTLSPFVVPLLAALLLALGGAFLLARL